jgi:hypothetical protein
MRWGEEGGHAVCHVRALYRSEKGQWQAFWQRKIFKEYKHQPMNYFPLRNEVNSKIAGV